jgi:hypothetical protein
LIWLNRAGSIAGRRRWPGSRQQCRQRLGIAKLFTHQVVPTGGVSGAILVVRGLARRGVPTNVAMAVLLVGLVAFVAVPKREIALE